ncbi:MAG: DUF1116 domain-containing protein [Bacillota bacterium]
MNESSFRVINVGIPTFGETLRQQGAHVADVDWRPPAWGDPGLIDCLERLEQPAVDEANARVFERITASRPYLVGVARAIEVVPGMRPGLILHAGPPVTWEQMCGPMRGAVIGALIYEGWADTPSAAEEVAGSQVEFRPCHEHDAVGPMAGIMSWSMPVFILENRTFGNRAYCTLNEGLGKVLRYGAYSGEVIARLKWMEEELGPALERAIQQSEGFDVRAAIAQALHMGDECHNRNKAGTALFLKWIAPYLAETADPGVAARAMRFIASNDHFFLNLSMPCCKAMMDAASNVPHSSVVTAMARNGREFGIRVSGTGDRWFTAPASSVRGLYFPGFGPEDANPDIGDSTITETAGIGGFAMAGAPAIVQFVGGTVHDAFTYTRAMYEITVGEHPVYTLPNLDFRGTPTGIDVRKVVSTGILPHINTGIAHKLAGVGQVGAGLVSPPREVFIKALAALAEY